MTFSKKWELAGEYYKWLQPEDKDCPINVITFLDSKGLLIDRDVSLMTIKLSKNVNKKGNGEHEN